MLPLESEELSAQLLSLACIAKRCLVMFARDRCTVRDVLAELDELAGREPEPGAACDESQQNVLARGDDVTPLMEPTERWCNNAESSTSVWRPTDAYKLTLGSTSVGRPSKFDSDHVGPH